jgi:hypothetical protein
MYGKPLDSIGFVSQFDPEIAAMMGEDNYGTADLKNAGCTVLVNGFVKAASKIGK